MAKRLAPHCGRGHIFTEKTTSWRMCRGYRTRICRICRSQWDKMKYHGNPVFREAKKARNKVINTARYAAIKAGNSHAV